MLVQRFKAVELAATEGTWAMSQQVELVPEARVSSMGTEERASVARREQRDARSQQLVAGLKGGGKGDGAPTIDLDIEGMMCMKNCGTVVQAALQGVPGVVSAEVAAGGARLFPIRLPPESRLVLGVNGSPLMQMTVFAADGSVLMPAINPKAASGGNESL